MLLLLPRFVFPLPRLIFRSGRGRPSRRSRRLQQRAARAKMIFVLTNKVIETLNRFAAGGKYARSSLGQDSTDSLDIDSIETDPVLADSYIDSLQSDSPDHIHTQLHTHPHKHSHLHTSTHTQTHAQHINNIDVT